MSLGLYFLTVRRHAASDSCSQHHSAVSFHRHRAKYYGVKSLNYGPKWIIPPCRWLFIRCLSRQQKSFLVVSSGKEEKPMVFVRNVFFLYFWLWILCLSEVMKNERNGNINVCLSAIGWIPLSPGVRMLLVASSSQPSFGWWFVVSKILVHRGCFGELWSPLVSSSFCGVVTECLKKSLGSFLSLPFMFPQAWNCCIIFWCPPMPEAKTCNLRSVFCLQPS